MRQWLGSTSYTWKIMISFMFVLLIPVTLSAVFIYIRSIQYVEDQAEANLRAALAKETDQIKQVIANYEKLGSQIAQYPLLIAYFDDLSMSDANKIEFSYQYLNSFMNWVHSMEPSDYYFRFFTKNENTFQNEWVYHARPFLHTAWFQAIQAEAVNAPYWERLHPARILEYDKIKSPILRKDEISFFVPMLSYTSEVGSTLLEIFIKPEAIFGGLSRLNEFAQGTVVVLDGADQLVYQTNELPAVVLEQLSNHHASKRGIQFGNQTFLTDVQLLDKPGYRIIGMFPQKLVVQETTKARNVFLICLVTALILMVCMSYFFSTNLTKKIKKLVKVMRTVQEGNLNTQVRIEGNDEIAKLGTDFNRMLARINELIGTVYKIEILQKDALLKALQNQINPHFLYNTLETIKMMAEIKREREISDALTSLGGMMRYNLTKESELVLISEEIQHIRSYCNLQSLMMNERLVLICDIAEPIRSLRMLKLILQPIVENAILHGFRNFDGQCTITVLAAAQQDRIEIIVADNGNGIEVAQLMKLKQILQGSGSGASTGETGIGLANVNERLRLRYGQDYGIDIESRQGLGTQITIRIPIMY